VTPVQPAPQRGPAPLTALSRAALVSAGTLCVALGALGLFLPLLPTTPFLLLAAACYARSSPRFLGWLLGNRWFGRSLRDYRERRGISLAQKAVTIALLWASIGYAGWFLASSRWPRLLLAAIATAVTIHLLRLPTRLTAAQASRPPCTRPAPAQPPASTSGSD
jgi:uncharacterized protein